MFVVKKAVKHVKVIITYHLPSLLDAPCGRYHVTYLNKHNLLFFYNC